MEILGIGPLEFIFIIIIALIVLGPNDMVKAGRTIGKFLRKIVTSDEWRTIQQASKEFRYLPNKLIREAGIEELKNELIDENKIKSQLGLNEYKKELDLWKRDISSWTTPPNFITEGHENNTDSGQNDTPENKLATNDSEQT